MKLLLRRFRRTVTVAGAALLAAFGLAVAGGAGAVPAVAATSSCAAAYSVPTDWGSGFTANLTITELEGDQRDHVYAEQVKRMPGFGEYAQKTEGIRTIPVLRLTRR